MLNFLPVSCDIWVLTRGSPLRRWFTQVLSGNPFFPGIQTTKVRSTDSRNVLSALATSFSGAFLRFGHFWLVVNLFSAGSAPRYRVTICPLVHLFCGTRSNLSLGRSIVNPSRPGYRVTIGSFISSSGRGHSRCGRLEALSISGLVFWFSILFLRKNFLGTSRAGICSFLLL